MKMSRSIFTALAALVLVMHPAAAAEPSPVVESIQRSLAALGYDPGPADGMAGARTLRAVSAFEAEFRIAAGGALTEQLAGLLGDPNYGPPTSSNILVLNRPGPAAAEEIAGKSHVEVLNVLGKWDEESLDHIDMRFDRPKATIFVVDEELEPGDVVMTQVAVIRLDLPLFTENYFYEVDAETPTEPMIIINESEAGFELQLTHRLFVNGRLVAEKRTRAAP